MYDIIIYDIVAYINNLPKELIDIIKEYIPKHILAFLNKQNYVLYHSFVRSKIPMYENFIRDTIRRDHVFVFEFIVNENINKWINNKNYNYKNMVYSNYLTFVTQFCIDNNSDKCKNFFVSFLKEHDLCKNLNKKNIIKHIRWKK